MLAARPYQRALPALVASASSEMIVRQLCHQRGASKLNRQPLLAHGGMHNAFVIGLSRLAFGCGEFEVGRLNRAIGQLDPVEDHS